MKYICEICKTQYDTAADAEKCEVAHNYEHMEEIAKISAAQKISDAINAYIAKYKELPGIDISLSNHKQLIDIIVGQLSHLFGCMLSPTCECATSAEGLHHTQEYEDGCNGTDAE